MFGKKIQLKGPMPTDFRQFLADELEARSRTNPQYSLRAFAKSLGIGSSHLSKLIHKRQDMTDATLLKVGKNLGLDPQIIEGYRQARFIDRSQSKRANRKPPKNTYQVINTDRLRMMTDWHNLAILETLKLADFQPRTEWIAQRLGLSINVVQLAADRLVRLGFLEITPEGQWIDRAGSTTSVNNIYSDAAAKHHQQQILELASRAIDSVPLTQRDQSAMLMAIDTARLEKAKAKIARFRRELCAFLEDSPRKDGVYYLSTSLFPINPQTAITFTNIEVPKS